MKRTGLPNYCAAAIEKEATAIVIIEGQANAETPVDTLAITKKDTPETLLERLIALIPDPSMRYVLTGQDKKGKISGLRKVVEAAKEKDGNAAAVSAAGAWAQSAATVHLSQHDLIQEHHEYLREQIELWQGTAMAAINDCNEKEVELTEVKAAKSFSADDFAMLFRSIGDFVVDKQDGIVSAVGKVFFAAKGFLGKGD